MNKVIRSVFFFLMIGIILSQFFFIVHQHERAFIIRLGQLVTDSQSHEPKLYAPGLHTKWPFFDTVYPMDPRDQIWTMDADKAQSVEQLYMLVDFYCKWRVQDYSLFFRVHTNGGSRSWDLAKKSVELLLRQKVRNAVLEEFGRRPLSKLIAEDRKHMMSTFGPSIEESLKNMGVVLVDFRLKKIELPEDVSEKIYNRMRTEREKSAAMHRARGKEKSEKIRAQTDYDVQVLIAQAQKKADILKGSVEAQLAQKYAEAFSEYEDFYNFTRSLQTYKEIFHANDVILLRTNDSLFEELIKRNPS